MPCSRGMFDFVVGSGSSRKDITASPVVVNMGLSLTAKDDYCYENVFG
jgi:hypothetical protein